MTAGEELWEAVFIMPPRFPRRSHAAEALARWGTMSHRLGRIMAALFLLMTGALAALTPELLGHQAMSFVLFGIVLALGSYLGGWIMFWILQGAGVIYDPVAATSRRVAQSIVAVALPAWDSLVWLATDPGPRWIRAIMVFATACWCAVARGAARRLRA